MQKFELWYPLKNPLLVTQRFGENLVPLYANMGMKGHNGWDIVGLEGQRCRAAHDGIVTFAGEDGSGGLGIVIRTKEKFWYENQWVYFKTIYWHLKPGSIIVKASQEVKVGDIIAQCDTTGLATASHLHFGLKPLLQGEQEWEWGNLLQTNGYLGAIDPAPFWNYYYAEDAQGRMAIMNKMIEILKKVVLLLTKQLNAKI